MPRLREEEEVFEVPLTPLIDVVFLLLIFFLVATNFTRREIDQKIKLPEAEGGVKQKAASESLVINIRKGGTLVVNGRVIEQDSLRMMIESYHREHPEERVSIRGDADVSYQRVMQVMGVCKAVGVTNVDLPVEDPSDSGMGP